MRRSESSARIATPARAVLDASALLRGLLGREDPAAAEWIDAAVRRAPEALVPDLAFAEVANALAVSARAGRLAPEDGERTLDALVALPLRSIPSRELAPPALRLALSRAVSAYDGCYLALAEAADAVLVTTDRRLAAAATRSALLPGTRPPV